MVPEGVGWWVHEEEASVGKFQLHRFNLSAAPFSSSVSVSEDKVSSCSQRDGSNGTGWVQLLFVITMLPHVILPVFVPGGERSTLSISNENICIWCWYSHLLIKTKLKVWPVVFVTASRIYFKVGVHGQAKRATPE